MPIHSLTNAIAAEADASASTSIRARNMQQLVLLRWIAVVGQLLAIGVVHYGLGIALPLQPMLLVVGGLAVFNLLSLLYQRQHSRSSPGATPGRADSSCTSASTARAAAQKSSTGP